MIRPVTSADHKIQDIMILHTDGYLDVCLEIGDTYFELSHDSIHQISDCLQNMTSVIPDEVHGLSLEKVKTNEETLFIVISGGYGLSYGFGIEEVDGTKEILEFYLNAEDADRLAQFISESDVRDVEFA